VAAGSGARFGGKVVKQFLDVGGHPILEWCVRAFRTLEDVGRTVVVVPADVLPEAPGWLCSLADRLVAGGRSRAESVSLGVAATRPEAAVILIHDGVRPFVSAQLVRRVIAAAREMPVVPILPMTDTIKEVEGETVTRTVDRSRLGRAQTPQGFPAALLRRLLAESERFEITDDVALCEAAGIPVRAVPGDPQNVKITTQADLEYAEWLVGSGRLETR
jgi:2-C-methyl-D-erythritol 4-phosphate cytidylyltransferase